MAMACDTAQVWEMADAILEQLYDNRPDRVLIVELRKGLPQFNDIPEESWIEALKALSDAGLADVGHVASGIEGNWGAVVNAGVSRQGEQEVAEFRAVEAYCGPQYKDWSEPLYENIDRVGANLREDFAFKGLLRSSSYFRAATDLVFDRLRGMEGIFTNCYLRVVQERTALGVCGLRERGLCRKVEYIWGSVSWFSLKWRVAVFC